MRILAKRWGKALLGIAALALVLLLVYLLTAGWLELAIIAVFAFTLGRLSARVPRLSFRKEAGAAAANETKRADDIAKRPSRRKKDEPDIEALLTNEPTELGFEEVDAEALAARIQREVEERQRGYDPAAALAARREKLARRSQP